ncbi:MAG: hypothetical protein ABWZ79_04795 [Pedobacter agri]
MKTLLRAASLVSWVTHPLFTSIFLIVAFSLNRYPVHQAMFIVALLVIGVMLPMNLVTYIGVKRGRLTNFDVSSRKQRTPLYFMVIVLMMTASCIIYAFDMDKQLFLSCLLISSLLSAINLINYFIKVSLHVSLNVFFCFIVYKLYPSSALFSAVLMPIVGFSRVLLGRHSQKEVILAGVVGLLFGATFLVLSESKKTVRGKLYRETSIQKEIRKAG